MTDSKEVLEAKGNTGLDTKYQLAFNLYDFDGDGLLRKEDLKKTLCCAVAWPYDENDKGRLVGWPMSKGLDYKLERFEVEDRETSDQLTGMSLEEKLLLVPPSQCHITMRYHNADGRRGTACCCCGPFVLMSSPSVRRHMSWSGNL